MNSSRLQTLRLVAGLSLVLAADMAFAQSSTGGWATAFGNLTTLAKIGMVTVIALFGFGGLAALGYGMNLLLKKGGDRGDDIEWKRIAYTVIAGSLMLALGWVAGQTVMTMGGSQGDIGNTGAVTIR